MHEPGENPPEHPVVKPDIIAVVRERLAALPAAPSVNIWRSSNKRQQPPPLNILRQRGQQEADQLADYTAELDNRFSGRFTDGEQMSQDEQKVMIVGAIEEAFDTITRYREGQASSLDFKKAQRLLKRCYDESLRLGVDLLVDDETRRNEIRTLKELLAFSDDEENPTSSS